MISLRNILIVFNVFSVALGRHTVKILNGEDADIREFPYMVFTGICGGSIIDENTIMQAGHCGYKQNPHELKVYYSNSNFREGLETNVSKIIVHENYTGLPPLRYDIALLKVDPPLVFSETAQPIKLAQKNAPNPRGKPAKVAGWGQTSDNQHSEILQKLNETITDNITCENAMKDTGFPVDSEQQICAQADMSDGVEKGACYGDSGSPLTIDGVQYGIATIAYYECGSPKYPTVFTRVAHYIDWITDKL